jgi:hypothetical protein
MPALRNQRHEAFARHIFESPKTGWSAKRCYQESGYATHGGNSSEAAASRLLRSVKLQRRIAELNRPLVRKTEVSMESLLEQIDADRAMAFERGQASAAVKATMLKARICGFLVDREEHGAPGEFSDMTYAEILAKIRAEFGDEAADAIDRALDKRRDD